MPNGYPPPIYYPPQRTNWAGIIAGLAAVGIGGYFVYWLWKNGYFNGNGTCNEGATKCIGTDLYRCENKKWVLYEPDSPDCSNGGNLCELVQYDCTPELEGLYSCSYLNWCRCTNGTWVCKEKNAIAKCTGTDYQHNKCYVVNGKVDCLTTYEPGEDTCLDGGENCSCASYPCQDTHYCASDKICIARAQNVWVEGEVTRPNCDAGPYYHTLEIPLEKPYAITKILSGSIVYYDCANPYADIINWSLWSEYKGVQTQIRNGWYSSSGQYGWFYLSESQINVSPMAVDKIYVILSSAISNVIPYRCSMVMSYY
jgi:hypothetical protein